MSVVRRVLVAALCAASLLLGRSAQAQDEPTPFWMPVEPEKAPKEKKDKPDKPKKKKPDAGASSIYIAPGQGEEDEPPHKKRPSKGTVKSVRPEQPAKQKPARQLEAEPEPEPAPKVKKKAFEPLPPLPHLEPEAAPKSAREPETIAPRAEPLPVPAVPMEPAPGASPAAEEPVRRPVLRPKKEAFGVEEDEPAPAAKPKPAAPPAAEPAKAPGPAKKDEGKTKPAPAAPAPVPPPAAKAGPPPERPRTLPPLPGVEPAAPARATPLVTEPAPAAVPVVEPVKESEPEEYVPVAARWRRSIWLLALGGLWQKQHGDGRGFEPAYGVQAGWAPVPWLLADLTAVRAGQGQGNGFASARVDHTLFLLRAFATWNRGAFSLFAGGGAGGVLAQTVYTLQDVGQPASTLPATALKLAAQAGAGARLRPWRGLEVRTEVTTLLRDGRLEPLVTLGAGWAF